jgi:beta-glucosidase
VADTFGDLVDGWQPVNEMNYYAQLAYGGGGWPPVHDDREERALAHEAIHLATAEAAVRLRSIGVPVASIFGLSVFVPLDDGPETAATVERGHASMWDPGIGLYRDGVLRCPNREPVERPDLAECFDLVGFSFYANTGVRDGQRVRYPVDAPVSPLGYGIDGAGLALVLDRLHEVVPDAPLLVAEFGVGTDDDEFRAEYLRRGLTAIDEALTRGIDVRGFFHWTAVDNSEWHHGFDVSFGIIDGDRNVRPSALVLHDAAHG